MENGFSKLKNLDKLSSILDKNAYEGRKDIWSKVEPKQSVNSCKTSFKLQF